MNAVVVVEEKKSLFVCGQIFIAIIYGHLTEANSSDMY